jgi:hypothetical protein
MTDEFKDNKVMQNVSLLKSRKKPLFMIIFLVLHCLILYNFIYLSKDMITGDFSGRSLIPRPRYGFMRVPRNPFTLQFDSVNRLAADFAPIYFPSQKLSSLAQAYTKETLDPWHRPSRSAPLIHAICSVSLCRLNYGYASFLHMTIQILLFFLSFVYAYKILHLERYILNGILLVNFCLFLTPVGLSWFERGQFSLYVSLSYLWLMLGLINRNVIYLFLSAIFAYIKWTSFPFIFVAFTLFIISSKNIKELKQSVFLASGFMSIIILLFLSYPKFGVYFIVGCIEQELQFVPAGLSLTKLLPRFLVKALPFVLIIFGYVHIRKFKNDYVSLFPFLVGSGIILVCYPTLAYDYSVPCLLGFIPLILYWTKLPMNQDLHLGYFLKYLFFFFIIIASSAVLTKLDRSETIMISGYIFCSLAFLLLPVFYPVKMQQENRMRDRST